MGQGADDLFDAMIEAAGCLEKEPHHDNER